MTTDQFQQPAPADPEPGAGSVELHTTLVSWYEAIRQADQQIAYWTGIRGRAVEHVQNAMGDATQATIDGRPVITWKPSKPSLRLDRKRLEDKFGPEVIAEFLVESKAPRPFRILTLDEQ
jgi:hypothetical protein